MNFLNKVKNFTKSNYKDFFIGIILGAVIMVPGVSGGTMAIILGVYAKIISSINHFFKFEKKTFIYIVVTGLGAALGVVILGSIMTELLERYPTVTNCFFVGVVLGSFPLLLRESRINLGRKGAKKRLPIYVLLFIAGAGTVVGVSLIKGIIVDLSRAKGVGSIAANAFAGFSTAAALVLPGISGSLFLKGIGFYETLVSAVSVNGLNLFFLTTFGTGLVAGVFATAKAVERLFEKHRSGAFILIIGFLAGTVFTMVYDAVPKNGAQTTFCLLSMIAGSLLTLSMFYISVAKMKKEKAAAENGNDDSLAVTNAETNAETKNGECG